VLLAVWKVAVKVALLAAVLGDEKAAWRAVRMAF